MHGAGPAAYVQACRRGALAEVPFDQTGEMARFAFGEEVDA